MAIVINGQTDIDAGHLPISNAGNTEVEGTFTGANATVNSITANSVITQGQNVSPFSGFKNYIINGSFDIQQRGTSGTTVPGTLTYTADRWSIYSLGAGVTQDLIQESDVTGDKCLTVYGASGVTILNIAQRIESYIGKRLAGKAITVSYKIYSSSNRNISYNIWTPDVTDIWPSSSIRHTGGINLSSGWNYGYFTVTLDSTAYRGFAIGFIMGAVTSGNIGFAQVQLEEGSVATPFEQRPYGLELSLCQRYYEALNIFGWGYTSTSGPHRSSYNAFKVTKRIAPTITFVGQTYLNCSSLALDSLAVDMIGTNVQVTTSGPYWVSAVFYADAELQQIKLKGK